MKKQAQHPLFNQFLGELFNTAHKYFSEPTTQSPVPGTNFPTQFQQDIGNVGQGAGQYIKNLFAGESVFNRKPISMSSSVPVTKNPMVIPTATPTTSPTPIPGVQGFTTSPVPPDYSALINESAQKHGVNPALLASILFTEHGFSKEPGINRNPDGSYDRGPAQINTLAHPEITDQQAYDPKFAIPWAAQTLKRYIDQTGSPAQGVAAYNVGPGGATVYGKGSGKLGPRGTTYLNKVKQGLAPEVVSNLGL